MVLVTALLGVVVRIGRKILDHQTDDAGSDPVRTGSFDSWPAVPTAPGPHRSGG
jgi:hypothetical protein